MEGFEWHDPLLITDASSFQSQDQTQTRCKCELSTNSRLHNSNMENPDEISPSQIYGRSALGFSLTSPDLVICMGSPDIPTQIFQESPYSFEGERIDISLENGIEGSKIRDSFQIPSAMTDDLCTEASFELVATQLGQENKKELLTNEMNVNVGCTGEVVFHKGLQFSEDVSFEGGDVLRSEGFVVGDDLYKTARFGNFLYYFKNLKSGNYVVELHFAEIVFVDGPSGMRVFDVFIQDQKAIASLDIYERVGAIVPLVISDLRTYICSDEGLCIRFEGVIGSPIVCGISVKEDSSKSAGVIELCEDVEHCSVDGELHRLQIEHDVQRKELVETRSALVALKKENELKSRECKEALKSLRDLQNELMRKSMHVGSLAFAIEGQVKEKSKWFSTLRDLTRKLKLLKMDHISLSEEALLLKHYLLDAEKVTSTVLLTTNQLALLHGDLKTKFLNEVRERKELYNKVLELKGNIRVFCRCRPMNSEEIIGGASTSIEFEAAKECELSVKSNGVSRKTFKFDAIFRPEASQVEVFEETSPLASSVLDGYNVCIFAYGQTGTGKTFTMEGTNEARGVNYRTLEMLFHIIEERKTIFRYEVSVSVLEVYNEQIRDLLVSGSQAGVNTKRLEIKQVGEGGLYVPGLVEAHVSNVHEVWEVLRTGSNGRAVGSTNVNEHSSRSHCMHRVMVKGKNLLNGECTTSKLWLVDLAGSERIAKTEVQGERLKETQNINRSLSALGDVISALATKSPHIPFRNSKLTHLLQDSLGGDSKTLMFVQISPNENDAAETLCSLNFASRVRGIELGPAKKQTDNTELLKYKQTAEKLKLDMKSKEYQVRKMEDANYGLEVKIKERDIKNRSLQDKIKELESQLLVERKLARQHVDTKIAEQRQEEHKCEPLRAPLSTTILGENKKFPLHDSMEKENNPDLAPQFQLPKRTGRASLCPTFQRIPSSIAPRRSTLIPAPSLTKLPSSFLPMTPIQAKDGDEAKSTCLPDQIQCESPKDLKNGCKKVGSVLRRSVHKKSNLKSPLQRRIGVNVGTEKVRVSIGGRGRIGPRGFVGNARRLVTTQQKQNHKEKERGWNIGTGAGKALL